MITISDVAKLLSEISKVVKDTRSILKAITDGKEYLMRKCPSASNDISKLLKQMQKTMVGLAAVTGVAKRFKFTLGSDYAKESDLRRFNEHLIKHDRKVENLGGNISKLKGDCEKIKKIRDKLNDHIKSRSESRMFGLFGIKASRKRHELSGAISNFYADDQEMIFLIEKTLALTESALKEVNDELGPSGRAFPSNVPKAASTLGVYAELFEEPYKQLHDLAGQLDKVAKEF